MSNCEDTLRQLSQALDQNPNTERQAHIAQWLAHHSECAATAQTWLFVDDRLRGAPLATPSPRLADSILAAVLRQHRHDRRLLAALAFVGSSLSLVPTLLVILLALLWLASRVQPALLTTCTKLLLDLLRSGTTVLFALGSLSHTLAPWTLPLLAVGGGSVILLLTLTLARNTTQVRTS
ncbi:MAG: hypothetical protein GXP37_01935 [Chloroflexi bacterium]|nr:hypothetical protein [Chloroflexota bacterium]